MRTHGNPIRIGTRESQLALWQANLVYQKLTELNYRCEIVPIKSTGDLILDKPIYQMGLVGVFTKTLDIALLNHQIDIAVHSMKDVPTQLPQQIIQAAVLPRGEVSDVLLYKDNLDFLTGNATIATGSLRRSAQWLARFPQHQIVSLRGNVISRLEKLAGQPWNGAIFAAAGLIRLNQLPLQQWLLDWMIPAPAQGAIMLTAHQENHSIITMLKQLNHSATEQCVKIERDFLHYLEGGCSAPIGAYAQLNKQQIQFKGGLFTPDGSTQLCIEKVVALHEASDLGRIAAFELLEQGGREIMQRITSFLAQ